MNPLTIISPSPHQTDFRIAVELVNILFTDSDLVTDKQPNLWATDFDFTDFDIKNVFLDNRIWI